MKTTNEKKISIEDSFKTLDKIIEQMDDDKCSIEKGIELYEKGLRLINDVSKKVDKIEKDIEILEAK